MAAGAPEEVSFEDATFVEPLGCVLRAQQRAALPAGRSVLVLGSGLTGLLHIQLAGALGAGRIMATDMVDYRLEAARRFGAEAVFRASEDVPARLLEVNEGRLADLVVVCTGAIPALQQALQSVERGGTVLFFAPTEPGATLSVSVNDTFFRNNVTLTTSYAAGPADLATALELIRSRRVRVGDMITHRLGLADTGLGFKLTSEAQSSLKVIVEPQR